MPAARQNDPRSPDTTVDKGDKVEPLIPTDAEPTTPDQASTEKPLVTGSTFAERRAVRLGQARMGIRGAEGKVIAKPDAENK